MISARVESRQPAVARTVAIRVMLALALVLPTVFAGGTAATAASDVPPNFELPFRCTSVWQGSTYTPSRSGTGHPLAIDFNKVGPGGGLIADQGQPVVAAASGRVKTVRSSTGTVIISHGNGWETRYVHMSGISVKQGQFVSQGQLLGGVDDVGEADGDHLHYAVFRNGVQQRPVFGGVVTAVNPGSRQEFTSYNCKPGNHGLWFANGMLRAPDGTVDLVTSDGERYWVDGPTYACLTARGIPVKDVSTSVFNATPRNEYGDPAGRWANCQSWALGWMVRGSGPEVFYVAPNGFRYYVGTEATVMCLGGWDAIRPIADADLNAIPKNPWNLGATCNTPLFGKMVMDEQGNVHYVGPRGHRYWVPNESVVEALGGRGSIVNIRTSRVNTIPANPYGHVADANTPLRGRLVWRASGQFDFVSEDGVRWWVPNAATQACLGGKPSAIYLEGARFDAIPRNAADVWASCATATR